MTEVYRFVGCHDQQPALSHEPYETDTDILSRIGIQSIQGLVEKPDFPMRSIQSGESQSPALPGGQVSRRQTRLLLKPHSQKQDALSVRAIVRANVQKRRALKQLVPVPYMLDDSQARFESVLHPNKVHLLRKIFLGISAFQGDRAGGGPQKPGQNPQKAGFPNAIRAGENQAASLLQGK